jgi:DNA-binding transcriptional MerR regulator
MSQSNMTYTITDLAAEFDITPRAIRFYEDHGLLTPERIGANGQRRLYSVSQRTRLKLTLRGKRLGFSLSEIKEILDLYTSPQDTVAQLRRFQTALAKHRKVLEQQLHDVQAQLKEIKQHEAQSRKLLQARQSRQSSSKNKT